jgi:hypothetical protein
VTNVYYEWAPVPVEVDAAGEAPDDATMDATASDVVALVIPEASPDAAADVAADAPDAPEAGTTPLGQPCTADYECLSNACDSVSLTCVASQCDDHRVDGAETDVDCGGPACPACPTGEVCKVDDDCATFACDAYMRVCITNACDDHRQDRAETGVDCGGGTCSQCALGKGCLVPSDCASGVCDTLMHVCIASQCQDHVKDGTETDVDCGGPCCSSGSQGCCAPGEHCGTNFDCVSGHFCNGTKVCQ